MGLMIRASDQNLRIDNLALQLQLEHLACNPSIPGKYTTLGGADPLGFYQCALATTSTAVYLVSLQP